MAKIQTIGKFSDVINLDWSAPKKSELMKGLQRAADAMGKSTVAFAAFIPINSAFAAGTTTAAVNGCGQSAAASATFLNLHSSVMNMFSAGVVLVIIFAGAAWAMGHRSKALEILIGVCCGYILAIHAIDIRNFLSCI